jgi:hypothetical protein
LSARADRLSRHDEPRGEPAERLAEQPRAETTLRDSLRQRLADLPPWHPSSPHADRPRGSKDRPGQDGDKPGGSFWEQVPRLEALWKSHIARWPDKPATKAVRDGDPPGSWRGRGDQYLNPEQHAQAKQLISDLQRPEEKITGVLQEIERDNTHGGVLAGLKHCLKGEDRLKEKIAEKAEGDLGIGLTEVASKISDAVRYTICLTGEDYVGGYVEIRQKIESAGYQMIYSKNHWLDDPEYKGVNTRWRTPDGGRFELQFHTAESFYAKENLTHDSYDRLRAPDSLRAEQRELHAYQRLVSGAIQRPSRVHEIANSREPT